jgi:hypothetical protein
VIGPVPVWLVVLVGTTVVMLSYFAGYWTCHKFDERIGRHTGLRTGIPKVAASDDNPDGKLCLWIEFGDSAGTTAYRRLLVDPGTYFLRTLEVQFDHLPIMRQSFFEHGSCYHTICRRVGPFDYNVDVVRGRPAFE